MRASEGTNLPKNVDREACGKMATQAKKKRPTTRARRWRVSIILKRGGPAAWGNPNEQQEAHFER
jgi:hypothetical protein